MAPRKAGRQSWVSGGLRCQLSVLRTRDGKLDQADRTTFDALAGRLAAQPSKVLLHLHGGLVNETAGLETAQRLSGAAPVGFGLGPDWEQIYIVWRTGALETLKTNWHDLFDNDRIYRTVLKKLIGFVSSKLELPGATGRSAFAAVSLTPAEIEARLRLATSRDPFADVDVQIERDTPAGRGPAVAAQSDAALAAEFSLSLQLDPEFMSAADNVAAALTLIRCKDAASLLAGMQDTGRSDLERLDERIKRELTDAVPAEAAGRDLFTAVEVAKFLIKHGPRSPCGSSGASVRIVIMDFIHDRRGTRPRNVRRHDRGRDLGHDEEGCCRPLCRGRMRRSTDQGVRSRPTVSPLRVGTQCRLDLGRGADTGHRNHGQSSGRPARFPRPCGTHR